MDFKSSKHFRDIISHNNIPKIQYTKMTNKPQINILKMLKLVM